MYFWFFFSFFLFLSSSGLAFESMWCQCVQFFLYVSLFSRANNCGPINTKMQPQHAIITIQQLECVLGWLSNLPCNDVVCSRTIQHCIATITHRNKKRKKNTKKHRLLMHLARIKIGKKRKVVPKTKRVAFVNLSRVRFNIILLLFLWSSIVVALLHSFLFVLVLFGMATVAWTIAVRTLWGVNAHHTSATHATSNSYKKFDRQLECICFVR